MKPYKTAITIELKEVTQTITAAVYHLYDKHSAQDNKLMTSYHLVPLIGCFWRENVPYGNPFLKRFQKHVKIVPIV